MGHVTLCGDEWGMSNLLAIIVHYLECYLGYERLYAGVVCHYSSTTATRGHRTQGTLVAMGDDWRARDREVH